MKLEAIRLKNFKMFQNAQMTGIPDFCVLVGANGVGKSTLFDVFGFLRDCLTFNPTRAIQSRGGYKEVVSRGHEKENISIELQYRMPIAGRDRLVTYLLELGMHENRPVVEQELLRYKRGRYGSPYQFLNFRHGKGYAITNEDDFDKQDEELTREEQTLESPDMLAVKGIGQFQRFKAANAFRQLVENWHVSDFHIEDARGSKDAAGFSDHLSVKGDNLQLVANQLFENHRKSFDQIVATMKARVPGVAEVNPISSPDGRLLLGFKDGSFKDPFIDKYVSDGTLKMFAYLVLLHDPSPHPLLCIEEPENQLYHRLLGELAEEFRAYAGRGGQVFVSTHSPHFLNATRLNEVFWLEKENGFTQIKRAQDDRQLKAYMDAGDQMGFLWEQGFFGKADPQ
jgi:predicted ATPase